MHQRIYWLFLVIEGFFVILSLEDQSFGHSGFTGTYAWADPKNNLIYVFLSNRTYPTMTNNKISENNIRTEVHRLINDALE